MTNIMASADHLLTTGFGDAGWPREDRSSPFFCHGPTLVSFSGGRTSAYMLWRILCAHGGVLPDYVYVVFANTGREHEKTLRFVYEVGIRWGVRIIWVEWRPAGEIEAAFSYPDDLELTPALDKSERASRVVSRKAVRDLAKAATRFEIVGFNSADRTGKWFAELIRRKQYLPNIDMRYCTEKLKIDTMKWFMVSQGYATWFNMVGLRADEPSRVMKQVLRNEAGLDRGTSGTPLFVAGIVERVVLRFWLGRNVDPEHLTHPLPQGFDLGLRSYKGNCVDCFLKSRGKRAAIYREDPSVAEWSIQQEAVASKNSWSRKAYMARFDKAESVSDLLHAVQHSPELIPFEEGAGKEVDCTGSICAGDDTGETFDDGAIVWLRNRMNQTLTMPRPVAVLPVLRDLFEEAA
jgi:3'-phosphoadenosine 5'-phosphosulfate sulfotransferase (PAPS reductase)/FAD synthetase